MCRLQPVIEEAAGSLACRPSAPTPNSWNDHAVCLRAEPAQLPAHTQVFLRRNHPLKTPSSFFPFKPNNSARRGEVRFLCSTVQNLRARRIQIRQVRRLAAVAGSHLHASLRAFHSTLPRGLQGSCVKPVNEQKLEVRELLSLPFESWSELRRGFRPQVSPAIAPAVRFAWVKLAQIGKRVDLNKPCAVRYFCWWTVPARPRHGTLKAAHTSSNLAYAFAHERGFVNRPSHRDDEVHATQSLLQMASLANK